MSTKHPKSTSPELAGGEASELVELRAEVGRLRDGLQNATEQVRAARHFIADLQHATGCRTVDDANTLTARAETAEQQLATIREKLRKVLWTRDAAAIWSVAADIANESLPDAPGSTLEEKTSQEPPSSQDAS